MRKKEKYYQVIVDAIPEGRENAVTQRELAEMFGVKERDIRQAIADAREDGILIVSTTREGYFISDREEDVLEHYRLLLSYIKRLNTSILPARRFLYQRNKEGANNEGE